MTFVLAVFFVIFVGAALVDWLDQMSDGKAILTCFILLGLLSLLP